MNEELSCDIAQRELRAAAFHEVGHAVVCLRLGGIGRPSIWANTSERVAQGQKAWLGTFSMYGLPGSVAISAEARTALNIGAAPANWRTLVGLAGLVCELFADGITDVWDIYSDIEYLLAVEETSETDAAFIGTHWTTDDVQTVVEILKASWQVVERDATHLMRKQLTPSALAATANLNS